MALTKVTGDFIETGSITQGHLHSSHGITLDHIGDGSTNTFFTTASARSAISATGSLSYNNSTGVMSFTMPTLNTTNITEGNKLFFTDARARASISASGNSSYNSTTGVITSTDTNTTYTVGDGGLTQNNFTNTLKGKLDGIATSANNYSLPFTDNSANWNTAYGWGNHASAGYITSADGGNATTLDGIDSSQFLRSDGNDTFNGNLTVGSTTRSSNTVVKVLSNDSHNAGFEAYGNSQGTGYLYVGQDASYGGGISYNGDGSPLFAMYESADKITFFRRDNNTTREVFSYPYNTDTVTFNGAIYATNGNFSGNIIGKSDNTTEVGTYSAGAIKRIRMTQGGEIHFGDTTTSSFLGLTEGAVDNFGDQDRLGLYCRNELKIYGNSNLLKVTIPTSGNITFAEGATFGGAISASNLSGTNTGDQSYVATSGSALTLDDGNNQWNWATGSHAYAANSLRLWDQYSSSGGSGNPTTYGSILHYSGRSGHMDSQLYFGSSGELLYRYNFYGNNNWNAWQTLVTSSNYGSYALPLSGGTVTGDTTFSSGYYEFGNGVGSVSNDGSWNARLNVAGSQHARLDVKSVSDGIITTMYSHTGNGNGKVGTMSNHPLALMSNGTEYATLRSTGLGIGAIVSNTYSGAYFGRNHAYPTPELKGYGAEFMIGAMNTTIHINYRSCNGGTSGHTPINWYWRAGSSSNWSNHNFGNVSANGTITSTGAITTGVSADIKRAGINNTKYISLSGHLSGYGVNDYPTLKTNFHVLYFDAGGVYTGYITSTGGFTDQSDRSLKENIEDIPDALSKVMNLRGRYFTWINELQGNERQVGFIAQEVEEQLPEVVSVGAGDTKGVAYGKVTALLVNAMKEQQAQIELLKQEVELLKQ